MNDPDTVQPRHFDASINPSNVAKASTVRSAEEKAIHHHELAGSAHEPRIIRLFEGRVSPVAARLAWLAVVLAVVILAGQFWTGINPQDEGEMIVYPWLLAHGWSLYDRIWTMYPPASFVTIAALIKLGIPGLIAERTCGFVARLTCIFLVNHAATGAWRRISLISAPLSFSLLFLTANITIAAYAWILGLPVLLAGLLAVRARCTMLAALCFGVAALFRIEFGVSGVAALILFASLDRNDVVTRFRFLPAAGLVFGMLLVYGALDLLTAGRAFNQILADPILRVEPQRRLPLWPPDFGYFNLPVAVAAFITPPALVVAGFIRRFPAIVATNAAICILLAQVVQVADWGHLFGVAALALPWTALSLRDLYQDTEMAHDEAESINPPLHAVPRIAYVRSLNIMALFALTYVLFVLLYAAFASPLSPASRSFAPNGRLLVEDGANPVLARTPREARDERRLIAYLARHRSSGDAVFIAPTSLRRMEYNMTVLYYALSMRPASRYLEADPGFTTQSAVQAEIVRDLRSCRWLVLWKDPVGARHRQLAGTTLSHFVETAYRPTFENHTFEVREKR